MTGVKFEKRRRTEKPSYYGNIIIIITTAVWDVFSCISEGPVPPHKGERSCPLCGGPAVPYRTGESGTPEYSSWAWFFCLVFHREQTVS